MTVFLRGTVVWVNPEGGGRIRPDDPPNSRKHQPMYGRTRICPLRMEVDGNFYFDELESTESVGHFRFGERVVYTESWLNESGRKHVHRVTSEIDYEDALAERARIRAAFFAR